MICKNCSIEINPNTSFCYSCGTKVVTRRITTKNLFSDLMIGLGWDSIYFFTLKSMFVKPNIVITEYLNGTRKKYLNPFSYLLIGTAMLLTVFNFFKDDADALQESLSYNKEQIQLTELKNKQEVARFGVQTSKSLMKYFNIIALLFLPIFSFMSK